jgi:hypothetical protein
MTYAYTLYYQGQPVQNSNSKSTLQSRIKREVKTELWRHIALPDLLYVADMSAAVEWGNSGRGLRTWEILVNAPEGYTG